MILKDLSLSFGTQEIFRNINLFVKENEKVGIVGVNGAGKTTLFKTIMGDIEPDSGSIILPKGTRIGWLPQVINDDALSMDMSVLEFLLSGRPIEVLNNQLQDIYEKIANLNEREQQKYFSKIDEIQSELEYWDQYNAETTLLKIIDGMNISNKILEQKLCELSGGQKSKIAFAKLLFSNPELILLDEPTNHLDKQTKDYVINFLKNYKGTVYIISHDIDFLNEVTTQTLFLDKRTHSMKLYNGNYNIFKKQNEEQEKTLLKQAQIQQQEEEKLREIINRYASASGKKKKVAQDREKKLERLLENKIEIAPVQKKVNFSINVDRKDSNIPLAINNLNFRYDKNSKKNIINNLSFELNKGEKFLIIGQNGVGKSTLLKLIVGQLTPDSGVIKKGIKTDIGYYAQEHELLENDKTIIDNFASIDISQKQLRSILGRFLFYGDDIFKRVEVLSPGEKSRVALAKLSLSGSNFLILDEPTNHLDPDTQMIIAETFKTFPGTMLIVSHNPSFVDNLGVERTLVLPEGKLSYYDRNSVAYYHDLNTGADKQKRKSI